MSISHAEKLKSALEQINKGLGMLSGGPLSYYLDKNTEIVEEFFKRCCPFRVGDTVEITKEIDFRLDYGWAPYSHCLKVGDRAIVESVDFYKGKFDCMVRLEKQTWIDKNGKEYNKEEKSLFCFKEDMCRVVYLPTVVERMPIHPVCMCEDCKKAYRFSVGIE